MHVQPPPSVLLEVLEQVRLGRLQQHLRFFGKPAGAPNFTLRESEVLAATVDHLRVDGEEDDHDIVLVGVNTESPRRATTWSYV